MKKVLVTGANGLLGANLVRELIKQGYAVRALLRANCDKRSLLGVGFETVTGEISKMSDLETAVDGCEYVIHCAARTVQFPDVLPAYHEINVMATDALCKVCLTKKVRRLVFVSTANCFTNGTMENPGTEESDFMPWLGKSGYAYSKFLAQKIVLRYVHEKGLNAIVVAPTFMIGAFDAKQSSGQLTLHGLKHKIILHPEGGKSFVDVKAVAKATVHGLKMGKTGECYLLAGTNMRYSSFFSLIGTLTGKNKIAIQLAKAVVLLSGALTGLLKRFIAIKTPFNSTNARLLTLDNYFLNKKAKDDLLMPETNLEKALSESIQWFEANGYLSNMK